jgi:Cu(I)/Ag(I) efflux system membrane fusion protein
MKLKPDMFVNAIIKIPLGSAIVVPVTAVMDTGKRQVAWVESSPGMFEPRDVQVGQRTDDKIQILSGINPGDKVAVSGGYLIDSESQLKGGGGSMPGMKMDEPKGAKQSAVPPAPQSPATKKSLKMDDMKM